MSKITVEKCRADYTDGNCSCEIPSVCPVEWKWGLGMTVIGEDLNLTYKQFAKKYKDAGFHEKYLKDVKISWEKKSV